MSKSDMRFSQQDLTAVAEKISAELPDGFVFSLVVFPDEGPGQISAVASCTRYKSVTMMQAIIDDYFRSEAESFKAAQVH